MNLNPAGYFAWYVSQFWTPAGAKKVSASLNALA
jgi:hypothetical protein